MSSSECDPLKVFEVEHESCLDFEVTVHKGMNITQGSAIENFLDTPDPYVVLRIPGSGNPHKQTTPVDNTVNPIWDTTFHFYLDPQKEHTLNVCLIDSNISIDEKLGEDSIRVQDLELDVPKDHIFLFPGGSKIYTTLTLRKNKNPDLRFSLALCDEEKGFLVERRARNCLALKNLLGPRGPKDEKQTPTVAVMGSGGGYRAMIALSGAVKALQEAKILDCATYIAGLSGSSWYISTLYSHDLFPFVTHDQVQAELKKSVTQDWKWHLRWAPKYAYDMFLKHRRGQPVSFTDFFGHVLGDALLQGKKDKKLSDLRRVVRHAGVPFPLFTCLHAKRSVSCKEFSEWVEFTPYEIGIAKYGTFMKIEHFGSKFIIGKVIKQYPEYPLHYLQGVWGSAFTILIKRLVLEGGKKDKAQIIREVQEESERGADGKWSDSDSSDSSDSESNSEVDEETGGKLMEDFKSRKKTRDLQKASPAPKTGVKVTSNGPSKDVEVTRKLDTMTLAKSPGSDPKETLPSPKKNAAPEKKKSQKKKRRKNKKVKTPEDEDSSTGLLGGFQKSIMMGTNFLNSRAGRAGRIHNPFRGLSLRKSFSLSSEEAPTPPKEGEEEEEKGEDTVDGIGEACRNEPLDNNAKKLYVVDSGLSFNSPYPLLLRRQRAVELYISFEFSKREKDDEPPFKELLLAEKWAQQNGVPFPPIKDLVVQYEEQPVQECYVFEHPTDISCPTIIHFCLVNNKFREYKAPGDLRTTKEEKKFGDFDLFNDPDTPYETTNFVYGERDFDRLAQLSEFNTLLHIDTIKEVLAKSCAKKQKLTKA